MNSVYSWARDAGERAASTFAQSFLSVIGGDALNVWQFGWHSAFGIGLGGALLSVLKSVAARNFGTPGTASLVN